MNTNLYARVIKWVKKLGRKNDEPKLLINTDKKCVALI